MSSAAIDLGNRFSRLAAFDRRRGRAVVVASIPTRAYAPIFGPALVGHAAASAIAADPTGAIDDLKELLGHESVWRNGRFWDPLELVTELLSELRRSAFRSREALDPLTECVVTVPSRSDIRLGELLQNAANRAGFDHVVPVDEAVAAAREALRDRPMGEPVAVVCDLGSDARIAPLRRRADSWRPDYEQLPAPVAIASDLPPLLFDVLRRVGDRLSHGGRLRPALVVVGRGARRPGIAGTFTQEGWPGEVIVAPDPENAAALGAVDRASIGRGPSEEARAAPVADLWGILDEGQAPPAASVSGQHAEGSWVAPDGTLRLNDYQLSAVEAIVASSRSKLREGRVKRLHLHGDEWNDGAVKRLRDLLSPDAGGDDWLARDAQEHARVARTAHPNLVELQITGCSRLTSAALLDLTCLATVAFVDLSDWRVRAAATDSIAQLASLPELRVLRLPDSAKESQIHGAESRAEALSSYFQGARPHVRVD